MLTLDNISQIVSRKMSLFRSKELQPMRPCEAICKSPKTKERGLFLWRGRGRWEGGSKEFSLLCLEIDMGHAHSAFFPPYFIFKEVSVDLCFTRVTGWYATELSSLQLRGRLLTPSGREASGTRDVFLEDVLSTGWRVSRNQPDKGGQRDDPVRGTSLCKGKNMTEKNSE